MYLYSSSFDINKILQRRNSLSLKAFLLQKLETLKYKNICGNASLSEK